MRLTSLMKTWITFIPDPGEDTGDGHPGLYQIPGMEYRTQTLMALVNKGLLELVWDDDHVRDMGPRWVKLTKAGETVKRDVLAKLKKKGRRAGFTKEGRWVG